MLLDYPIIEVEFYKQFVLFDVSYYKAKELGIESGFYSAFMSKHWSLDLILDGSHPVSTSTEFANISFRETIRSLNGGDVPYVEVKSMVDYIKAKFDLIEEAREYPLDYRIMDCINEMEAVDEDIDILALRNLPPEYNAGLKNIIRQEVERIYVEKLHSFNFI